MLRTFSSTLLLALWFGTPVLSQPQPVALTAASWQKFSSNEGKFRVLMPKPPELQRQSFPLQGTKIQIQMYLFTTIDQPSPSEAAAYTVAYADFPFIPTTREAADMLLDASQTQMLVNRTLLARSTFELKGNPGRELKLKDDQGMLTRVRLFLVKQRIYMVMAVSQSEPGLGGSDRFLDSFELSDR
jgi:hypothetical protein